MIKKIKPVKKYSAQLRTPKGTRVRTNIEKAHAFTKHLANVFQPHRSENAPEEEKALTHSLETPYQLESPINHLKRSEVQEVNSLKTKKSPGYDLITGKILKELPIVAIKYLTVIQCCHAKRILPGTMESCTDYPHPKTRESPQQTNILLAHKTLTHYIQSLCKAHLKMPPLSGSKYRSIPNHQFGFRQRHSTIEQMHHIVQRINEALETNQYRSAAFLDISHAFDKVWHTGLL
jgi:hypothetical protein